MNTSWVPAERLANRSYTPVKMDSWLESRDQHETAERFRYRDGHGQIGIIAAITQPFCQACSRARFSSRGELFPCLFASEGLDLTSPLLLGESLSAKIARFWQSRRDRYSELRARTPARLIRPEMSAIGG
ncbi:MAG TPA: hypothetical protein VKP30_11880 [Polyangiaceae bacterium]|nr:hypothetical protein [Polyangiaceae bacterium]